MWSKFVVALLISYSALLPAHPQLQLKGVSGPLAENIQLYLDRLPDASNLGSRRFQNQLIRDVKTAARALGYYRVDVSTELNESGKKPRLLIKVVPGDAARFKEVQVTLLGEAKNDADFAALIKQHAPKVNHRVHHGRYENLKKQLTSLAIRKGYFQAKLTQQELAVAPALGQGFLRLTFNSGRRFSFGEVKFSGSQIRHERLLSLVPFQAGDPYLASHLGELQQKLAESGWFASIEVEVDDPQDPDQPLQVRVTLSPQIRNTVETGVGYSTDLGPRLKLNWNKPWLNDKGHSLSSKMSLSGPEQSLEAGYKLPQQNVSDDFYLVNAGIKTTNLEDTNSAEYNLALERHWLLDMGWYRVASVRWLYEDYTQGTDSGSANLIMPGLGFNRAGDSGGSMPEQAYRYLLNAEVSDPAWGSDERFVRLRARAGWIGSFSVDQRWLIKLDAGAVLMKSVLALPPSLRFFAGGDNSIRGYSFESISPTADDGTLTGARYLATAALEYQHRLSGNWWLASFVDAGSAWNDNSELYRGLGFGVRWASPVGPVRLDFAWGLDLPTGREFQLHFALGPEL
ncbi:autotransporter assembly complex family protein [Rheinheimera sp.]|uniref:autotransporter assembly complex protein TamA n=1 Tax=Rheinheimera sp. TaxID=1869214 RepID=UPI00307E172A